MFFVFTFYYFMSAICFLSCPDAAAVVLNRDQDFAEALDSGGSDMEMDRGIVQVQEHSAQNRAKIWKVERDESS